MPWKLILFIIVIVFVAIFVGVNHANVCNISLIFTEFQQVPVYITILVSFVVGILIMLPFTIGKKRGKAYRQTRGSSAGAPTREEYPAENARNRRNRRRKEAAAKKAARNTANTSSTPATNTNSAPEVPTAEIPAITDGSDSSDSGKKSKSAGKGFFGLFSKKQAETTTPATGADTPAADTSTDKKPEETK
ncbi:MAG: hypothetical protein J5647_01525 [Spirochaetaceae bacterium]|nr:hypothetical protein [Spirochaetaceae bacterium]